MAINVQTSTQYQGLIEEAGSPKKDTINDNRIYSSLSERPSASDFGTGTAQVGSLVYASDGVEWTRIDSSLGSNTIAYIGDSRATYGNRPYWKSAVIHSNGSYQGLPLTLSGCGPAITADDVTGATCTLEYRASDGKFRWTAPSDTAGEWTLLNSLTTSQILQSGTTGKWLRLKVHNNTSYPASDVTLSVDVSGSLIWGKEARGYNTWLSAKLRIPAANVQHLGVPGQTTTGLFNSIAQHTAETTEQGVDFIRIGTNDITGMTDSPTATTSLVTMKANIEAYVKSRWDLGRFVVLLGETARLKSGTIASSPVAMDAWQLSALLDYNQWLSDLAKANSNRCRYVDLYELTVDATTTDGRPTARALNDHVHDSIQGAIDVTNKIYTEISSIVPTWKSYPVGKTGNGFGTNASLQATTTASGTGSSGVMPSTISSTLAQAAGTCTVSGAAVSRGAGYSSNWFEMTCAATADSSIIQWRTASKTLAALGKSVGDTVSFQIEADVANSTLVNYIDIFIQFISTSPLMSLYLMSKHTVTTPNEADVSFSGIFTSEPCVIPTGTTAITAYVYVGMQNGGSSVVKLVNIAIE